MAATAAACLSALGEKRHDLGSHRYAHSSVVLALTKYRHLSVLASVARCIFPFSCSGRSLLESVANTLLERVEELIHPHEASPAWGSPHLSVTPLSVAVQQLAAEVAALQAAVREMALEIQKLSRAADEA